MEACSAWAARSGVAVRGVEFRASPLGGLGAFATADVAAGDALLVLPRGFPITPHVCEMSLGDATLARSPRSALALFLCHEKAKGAASPWAPWLATLPEIGLDLSAFGASDAALAEAAAARREARGGPPAFAHTAWMASDSDADAAPAPAKSYEEEIRACRAQAEATLAYCLGRRPDLAETLPWAIATVATRAFLVNGHHYLLPLVEKMNHARDGGRLVVTSAGEIMLVAGAAARAGAEVFLNYFDGTEAASTPERILAVYGFELPVL